MTVVSIISGAVARALSTILSARHDPAARIFIADCVAVLVAILLPWSTSGVAICVTLWLLALAPTINLAALRLSLRRPICVLPVALFVLAVVATLWSAASWQEQLRGISPTAKFLVLPLLLYHFERSSRGMWVMIAFLISCTALLMMSFLVAVDPVLTLKPAGYPDAGIFVKDRIAQSQEFSLCGLALYYPVSTCWQHKRRALAITFFVLAVALIASMAFITTSRTALVTMPVMIMCSLLYFRWTKVVSIFALLAVLGGVAWFASPVLRSKTESFSLQYEHYKNFNEATSIGLRLEFWQKSVQFFEQAPLIGHGTGSVRQLFERAAEGQIGASAEVIGNPHNQTFYAAIQWGLIGVLLIYAMWLAHFLLFCGTGLASWIGMLVVVQNFTSSLFNSHLFDFHEGWMYVIGVGVAGGMVLGQQNRRSEKTRITPGKTDQDQKLTLSIPSGGANN